VKTTPELLNRVRNATSFIAALDQSGGSTPKALTQYGIKEGSWSTPDEMFALIHEIRTRIITSPAFTSDRILGTILFEDTMNRSINGQPTGEYLWSKNILPFIKVDNGLAEEKDGVQLMKPMPKLDELLDQSNAKKMFGTKMRSVIKQANEAGIAEIVKQQFEVGHRIIAKGLIPILEPEVDIKCPEKAKAESVLKSAILAGLNKLKNDEFVMLKLTLPNEDNLYMDCINHPQVVKVVALSGGYSRAEANARLSRNQKVVASFSRALLEGLTKQASDEEFNKTLNDSIEEIYQASKT
jgi:fructose-bisphosphate aldolase, class I